MSAAFLSLGCTLGISAIPIALLCFIPLVKEEKDKRVVNHNLLNKMLAFASGCLLGDAVLHLIPHAHVPEDQVGGWVLGGILMFMAVEFAIQYVKERSRSQNYSDKHSHSHSHSHGHSVDLHSTSASFLHIVADFAHNMTDGLAIALSFQSSDQLGWTTSLAVLIHEIPHELGDYASLTLYGRTRKQVLAVEAMTAAGAMMGCAAGLVFGKVFSDSVNQILLLTAGGFIYIACVQIIPHLRASARLSSLVWFFSGVVVMIVIALLE